MLPTSRLSFVLRNAFLNPRTVISLKTNTSLIQYPQQPDYDSLSLKVKMAFFTDAVSKDPDHLAVSRRSRFDIASSHDWRAAGIPRQAPSLI